MIYRMDGLQMFCKHHRERTENKGSSLVRAML
jgi:hypothetical protein